VATERILPDLAMAYADIPEVLTFV